MTTGDALESTILECVIAAVSWIQENRADASGSHEKKEHLSERRVFEEAGLSPSLADQVMNRRQKTVKGPTLLRLAKRWDIRLLWLMTGRGPIEPFDGSERQDELMGEIIATLEKGGLVVRHGEPKALPPPVETKPNHAPERVIVLDHEPTQLSEFERARGRKVSTATRQTATSKAALVGSQTTDEDIAATESRHKAIAKGKTLVEHHPDPETDDVGAAYDAAMAKTKPKKVAEPKSPPYKREPKPEPAKPKKPRGK